MATRTVTLKKGLKTLPQGSDTPVHHLDAVLREPTVGDLLDATEAAERAVLTDEGWQLLVSPTRLGAELVARQVVSIGTLPGPFAARGLRGLSPEDLSLLQGAADELAQAADRALEEVASRGRPDGAA